MYIIYIALFILAILSIPCWVSYELYKFMEKKNISKHTTIPIIIFIIMGSGLGFVWLIKTWLEGIPSV